jgi:hypothetical protein
LPFVGLPSAIVAAQESRKLSHERLILHLGTCQEIYKPNSLDALKQRINDYKTKTERLQREITEREAIIQQYRVRSQQETNLAKSLQEYKIV